MPTAGSPVRRQWGIPDAVAAVGRLFRMRVPPDAFAGDVRSYELVGAAPGWLRLDGPAGVLEGVPGPGDAGDHYLTVRARGAAGDAAKDVFAVEVRPRAAVTRDPGAEVQCGPGEEPVVATVLLDAPFASLSAAARAAAVRNSAGLLGLSPSALWLGPQRGREDLLSAAVVAAGPGDARRQRHSEATALRWPAGCGGDALTRLRSHARDGSLAEAAGAPVVGWHARAVRAGRERRELGSGDSAAGDDEASYNYEDDGDEGEGEETVPDARVVPTMSSPVFPEATAAVGLPGHPHRHHHGEAPAPAPPASGSEAPDAAAAVAATRHLPTSPVLFAGTILSTPVLVPVRPTRVGGPEDDLVPQPTRVYTQYAEVTPSATPVFYTEVEPSASTDQPTSQVTEPLPSSSGSPTGSSSSSSGSSSSSSTSETSTSTTGSGPSIPGSSPASSTESTSPSPEDTDTSLPPSPSFPSIPTDRSTTEKVEYGVKNIPPQLAHRLPKLGITAGKVFHYVIPSDTFSDLEDGDTRNLRLIFMHMNKTTVMPTSWVQFDIEKQEVYALPLEEHVSKWEFLLEAMDKDASSVIETLALQVQHHKGHRAVNHEFSISLRPPDHIHYAANLDWELELLNAIARTVGDTSTSHITVRAVNISGDPNVFTWTNDSLPRSPCPRENIEKIYQTLTKDKTGIPSQKLKDAVPLSLQLRRVSWRGLAQCDQPVEPIGPPQPKNFPPATRNPIDEISAVEGRLLVYKVPPDVFYDPELLPLKVTLVTIDNQPLPVESWLQFDSRNQEFYGIPMYGDKGSKEYNLVGEDSEGQKANDALVVMVRPAPSVPYTVEFSMTLEVPFEQFTMSPSLKRRFVERVRDLFGDANTRSIALARNPRPRSAGGGGGRRGTVVTWYNTSLPTDHCAEREIAALRRVLLHDDESVAARVRAIMDMEFPVEAITMTPTGACLGELTAVHVDTSPSLAPGRDDTVPVDSAADDYLVTYIVPGVIIVAMLLLAGIVACVLYRRRRTGKMSVGDEDERQSFRNKGIPVIFQDELDERPDPANKSPVIMKEEKPPLPPPEYQRGVEAAERGTPPPAAAPAVAAVRRPLLGPDGEPTPAPEDPPYQPPPPFTSSRDTGRGARPKPTPTYRKPPPYVPP